MQGRAAPSIRERAFRATRSRPDSREARAEKGCSSCLLRERTKRSPQCEVQRLAGNALHPVTNGPSQATRDGSRQRDRLNLQIESAAALLIDPVGVQAPKEAVLV